MQTYLYVSMYWRVALILPLIFCRDEESIKERESRERCVKICDGTFAAGLTIQFIMQMADTDLLTDWWIRMFYTLTTIFLAVVLTLSLRKLRFEQQRMFEGLLSDERLMRAHMIIFASAAALNLIACILLKLQEIDDLVKSDTRLEIAGKTLIIINFVLVSIS